MTNATRQPKAFVIDEPGHGGEDPPRRKPRAITGITIEPDDIDLPVVVPPAPLPASRRWRWGTLLVTSLFTLVSLWAGLAVTQLVEDFFARSPVLGWVALVAAGLAAFAALAIITREIWAMARLRRIEHIQIDAAHALNTDDDPAARRAVNGLVALYGNRGDAQLGLRTLKEHDADIMDGRDRVKLAERHLVTARDDEAHRIIARASRRITLLTTVTPNAALDMLFVAAINLRMMREVATLYGGRPTTLSTIRLVRLVLGHLAVAGGLALSDTLMQNLLGKGLLGKLSARFGEGAVNGILTARIGLAARDVCRPVPQAPQAKETLGSLMRELVSLDEETRTE